MMYGSQFTLRFSVVIAIHLLILAGGCGSNSESDGDADGDTDGDTDGDSDGDPRFDSLRETLESERLQLGAPGVAMAIIEGDQIVFAEGFGSRDPDNPEDTVEATTLFRMGSVNKILTAIAVMQLIEDGLITLDSPVITAIPEFEFAMNSDWADSIQVVHLLNQTAGLFDYGEFGAADDTLLETRLLWYLENLYVIAPSGRFWNYSNPNFSVAGWLVERLSGQFYREYMDSEVFTPLGMDRTYFLGEEVVEDGDYASGLTTNWTTGVGRAIAGPTSYDSAFMRPAGFAWTSVLDLADLILFLMHGDSTVLGDEERNSLTEQQISTEMKLGYSQYGLGLFVNEGLVVNDDFYDVTVVFHGGDISGFAADILYLPEYQVGLAILSNTDAAHFAQSIVGALLALDVLPEPTAVPEDMAFDPATLPDFVGNYNDPNAYGLGDAAVTLEEEEQLMISLPVLDALEIPYDAQLIPYSPDNFYLSANGGYLLLTFIRDELGEIEYLRTRPSVLNAVDYSSGSSPHPRTPFAPSTWQNPLPLPLAPWERSPNF